MQKVEASSIYIYIYIYEITKDAYEIGAVVTHCGCHLQKNIEREKERKKEIKKEKQVIERTTSSCSLFSTFDKIKKTNRRFCLLLYKYPMFLQRERERQREEKGGL